MALNPVDKQGTEALTLEALRIRNAKAKAAKQAAYIPPASQTYTPSGAAVAGGGGGSWGPTPSSAPGELTPLNSTTGSTGGGAPSDSVPPPSSVPPGPAEAPPASETGGTSPSGGAPTPPAPGSPQGSQSAFQLAFNQLMAQGKNMQGLQDQKNKLVQQLYDRPLTPEELRTLSPQQQEAIRNGDKALLEFQILTLNDTIKGRADENTSALTYLMDGYKLDQAELTKKAERAYSSFTSMLEKYPQLYSMMSPESIQKIQQGDLPTPEDMVKLGTEYSKLAKTGGSQTASIQEYEYAKAQGYKGSYTDYQNEDANRKALATGLSGLTSSEKSTALQLKRDFEDKTKDYRTIAASYNRVVTSATDPSAAGDLSLIFAYMKMLDPGSTVREGEFATAQNAGSIPQTIQGQYNKIVKGERMAASLRADFVDRAKRLYESEKKQFDQTKSQFEADAEAYGVPADLVVRDVTATGAPNPRDVALQQLQTQFPDLEPEAYDYMLEKQGFPKASAPALTSVKIGGNVVKVDKSISDRLARADAALFKATGQHLQINESYRSNERQAELYAKYKAGTGGRAAPPGKSFHGTGKAVDIQNWKIAEPYLRKEGLKNNLVDDKNHFSYGEFA